MVSPLTNKRHATGKRETAWVMLALLIVTGVYAMTGSDPDMVTARVRMIEVLAWPIITFAAFAYGAEWVTKQTNWGGAPDEFEGKVG